MSARFTSCFRLRDKVSVKPGPTGNRNPPEGPYLTQIQFALVKGFFLFPLHYSMETFATSHHMRLALMKDTFPCKQRSESKHPACQWLPPIMLLLTSSQMQLITLQSRKHCHEKERHKTPKTNSFLIVNNYIFNSCKNPSTFSFLSPIKLMPVLETMCAVWICVKFETLTGC